MKAWKFQILPFVYSNFVLYTDNSSADDFFCIFVLRESNFRKMSVNDGLEVF